MTTIARRMAWAAFAALLGHLLLMATPLHDPARRAAAGHALDVPGAHQAVVADGHGGGPAARGGGPHGVGPGDCALQPAPTSGRQPAMAAWSVVAPPLPAFETGALTPVGRAGALHPPWPSDPQALLQVFRL
jgi:hypothetical protein